MKKHWLDIVLILVFLIGLSVLLYPTISNYVNERHQSRVIAEYDEHVSEITEEDLNKALVQAHKYNEKLAELGNTIYENTAAPNYANELNVTGDGMMGYIYIPKIKGVLSIYHTTSDAVLNLSIGHMEGSSLPVGGPGTHAVLMGHRGLPSAKLFTDLDELEVGDRFSLNVLDKVLNYEVDQILIKEPQELEALNREPGKDYVTLVTCTPYGINTHRLLIRGHRIADDIPEEQQVYVTSEAVAMNPLTMAPIVAVPLLIIILIYALISSKKRRGRKSETISEEN